LKWMDSVPRSSLEGVRLSRPGFSHQYSPLGIVLVRFCELLRFLVFHGQVAVFALAGRIIWIRSVAGPVAGGLLSA